jgi:hypothetical protein
MRISDSTRVAGERPTESHPPLTRRRRDLASELLAVVGTGASLLRAAGGALRTGVVTITADPRLQRFGPDREGSTAARPGAKTDPTALIYELLDAHYDTAELVEELASDEEWEVHLEYLRALQRRGREVLARLGDRR